ncbi:MAG: hypothetical protein J6Y71_02640 [Ruminococcus sp.]|nr:hypothetical protein [Ruminococcus sp.]
MAEKKSFLVFCDRIKELEMLSDEECGKLFKALMYYAASGEEIETDSLPLKLMFSVFKSQIDENEEKYQKKKAANAEYYKKNKTNKSKSEISDDSVNSEDSEKTVISDNSVFSEKSEISKNSESDTVTDTVTDTDTVINIYDQSADKSAVSVGKSDVEKEFNELWELYPRKEGKKNAYLAYRKARIRKSDPCDFQKVKESIIEYRERTKDYDAQYIKQGKTYFQGECWNDVYPELETGKAPDPEVEKYKCLVNRF